MSGIEIDCATARERHGIFTLHHWMRDNGELRFRLIHNEGNAYIRTEASGTGGWQQSHFHKKSKETYIVEKGWIGFAEQRETGFSLRVFRQDEMFTTTPEIRHNVFMPANAIIHTIKHGLAGRVIGVDRFEEDCEPLQAYCKTFPDEVSVERNGLWGGAQRLEARYSQPYRHFDGLAWQVPAWSNAIVALVLTGLDSNRLKALAEVTDITSETLVRSILFALGFVTLCFSHVLHRFRQHQRDIAKKGGAYGGHESWWSSAAWWMQLLLNAEAMLLLATALLVRPGWAPMPWVIAVAMVAAVVFTVVQRNWQRFDSR